MKTTTKNIKWALKTYDTNTVKHQIDVAKNLTTLNKGMRMIALV